MYMLFKTIHVVAAIAWLGAGLTFQVMNLRARAAADPAGTAFLADQGEWFGQRFFSVASLTTLVSGVVMVLVAESLSFADLWITVGFAGIMVSIVVGAVLVTRATAALGEAVTAGDTPRVTALQARLNTLGWIDLAVVFTVVAFMVYKPT